MINMGQLGFGVFVGVEKPQTLKPEPLTRCMVGSFSELLHLNLGCLGTWGFLKLGVPHNRQ